MLVLSPIFAGQDRRIAKGRADSVIDLFLRHAGGLTELQDRHRPRGMMGSTSSALAKDGERNRNMQRHVALASVSESARLLYKDSVEFAKRSQKLFCSPAVDLPSLCGGSTKRRSITAPAAGSPR